VFLFVPQDYAAHDRGARRIDFMLRNLDILKVTLNKLDIPLYAVSHSPRRTLPSKAVDLAHSWGAKTLYANIGVFFQNNPILPVLISRQSMKWMKFAVIYRS
jgi:deoxyribodipyrimidine photo-lyase